MSNHRITVWLLTGWLVFLGFYAGVAHYLGPGPKLSAFANLAQCCVPLLANAGLLVNAGTPHWRRNIFWMLLALSCSMWMIGQFQWTYYEVYLRKDVPELFAGDIVFFLRGIPIIAALALRPHRRRGELQRGLGYLDFGLLLTWWTFLYVYMVLPWMYATPEVGAYNRNYDFVSNVQQTVIVLGFASYWLQSRGPWRTVYAHLFGASALYMFTSLLINLRLAGGKYYTGSWYDLPLMSVFFWYAMAGLFAYQRRREFDSSFEPSADGEAEPPAQDSRWATRFAMAAVLSLPLFALYALRMEHASPANREFRLTATLIASVPLVLLVFLRTHLADSDRARLLARAESSIKNLQRLQAQIVQSEKLASLGQLAAGAAHEINNPLTAILGYSDLLADDASLPQPTRATAAKIREQARRTSNLVQNLLSFARQVPPERMLLDINTVVANAVQLRALDLHDGGPAIELQLEPVLPGVRGDNNQLTQVFFNIITNAMDAVAGRTGGLLTIRTQRERGTVVALFSDNGPGIREPERVFDPFYTTKPLGKGTGLGLSICYGIVQEHGGKIRCYNGHAGGAVFRVELPVVLTALPTRGGPTGNTPLTNARS